MGKVRDIRILFNRPQAFYPGEVVSGRVTFQLDHPVKIKQIMLDITGECKVKFTVHYGEDQKIYKSKEIYIARRTLIYNGASSGSNAITELQAGALCYPFQFELPPNIPSTFVGEYGNVTYRASLSFNFKGGRVQTHVVQMLILNPIDLSQDHPAAQFSARPLNIQGQKIDRGCFGLSKDEVKYSIHMNKCAFQPGEQILIDGFIVNNSSKSTDKLCMCLIQTITYFGTRADFSLTSSGHRKSKVKKWTVSIWNGAKIAAHDRVNYRNQRTISIPKVPESILQHCQNINVEYAIQFSVSLSGVFSISLVSALYPIFIGSGFRRPLLQDSSGNERSVQPSAPFEIGFVDDHSEDYVSDQLTPPPTYQSLFEDQQ